MQIPSRQAHWRKALPAALLGLMAALVLSAAGNRAQAAPVLSLDVDCTPDTIRPHEEALFTCSTTIRNTGDATATDIDLMAMPASGLSLPNFQLFDSVRNGEPAFVSSGQISFEFPDIGPGESVQGSIRVIFGVGEEGSYGFQLDLVQGGQTVDSLTVSFDAVADSPYPPTNLVLSKTLITEPAAPGPLSPPGSVSPEAETAEYELVVTNESDVTMSGLTIFDKYNSGLVVASADPPASEVSETTNIARWEMGSLGPGEEHRVQVIFEAEGDDCVYTGGTMVVTAQAPGGEESYVAYSQDNIVIGTGDCPELGPGFSLPGTGLGGGRQHPVSWVWLAAVLAASGALAFGLAATRFRRHES